MQVIRPVPRYVESAKVEREILKALRSRDRKDEAGLVHYLHSFYHREHFCLVFRPLGLSLYELIKKNSFRGFPLKLVQSFLRQLLTSLAFIHKLGYTHTDLKPENILLEKSELRLDSSRDY